MGEHLERVVPLLMKASSSASACLDAVHIYTRLYSTDPAIQEGSIHYGRLVERVGWDEFILWVDDDDG